MSSAIFTPGQRVEFINPTSATPGPYDVLAVRDGIVSVRGIKGTPNDAQHWSGRVEEFKLASDGFDHASERASIDDCGMLAHCLVGGLGMGYGSPY